MTAYLLGLLLVTGCVNILLRAFPFLIFDVKTGKASAAIQETGKRIAPGAIAMLVVYCFALYFQERPLNAEHFFGASEWCAAAAVLILQLRFKNPLLSVTAGTILYMVLIQKVF